MADKTLQLLHGDSINLLDFSIPGLNEVNIEVIDSAQDRVADLFLSEAQARELFNWLGVWLHTR